MTTDPRPLVPHLLRLGGLVTADRLAARADLPTGAVVAVPEEAGPAGPVRERTGRIRGGKRAPLQELHQDLLSTLGQERSAADGH